MFKFEITKETLNIIGFGKKYILDTQVCIKGID